MKIHIPLEAIYPQVKGGPALSVHFMAQGFAELGEEVVVYVPKKGKQRDKGFKYSVVTSGAISILKYKLPIKYLVSLLWSRSDIYYLNSFFHPTTIVTLLFVGTGKVILAPRGELFKEVVSDSIFKKIWLKLFFNSFFSRFIQKKIKSFHVTSHEELLTVANLNIGIETVLLRNIYEPPIKIALPSSRSKRGDYIVHMSRISREKRIEKIILAFLKENSDLRLVIAGSKLDDEVYWNELNELVTNCSGSEKVSFTGVAVTGEEKIEILSNAFALVYFPLPENFGMVVAEALCYGTPVISGKTVPWSGLEERGAGYYCSIEDLHKNLSALRNMSKDDYFTICINAHKYGKEFSLDSNISGIKQLLKTIR